MRARGFMVAGIASAMLMVMAALWAWQSQEQLAAAWGIPQHHLGVWCVRSTAVATLAAAQVVLLSVVVHCLYRRDLLSDVLRLSGTLLFLVAAVGAIALGLASR